MKQKIDFWNPELYKNKHAFVYDYGTDLIGILKPQKHERILDLGCGSGQLTATISKLVAGVVGMDKSLQMIRSAQHTYPQLDFQVGNAASFSFKQPFDAIFSNATLHWVLDYKAAIACMYQHLKPSGRLVLEFGGKDNVKAIVQQLQKSLITRGYTTQSQLNCWFFPSIGTYTSALEAQGFTVTLAHYFDRPTPLADEQTGIKDWLSMFASSFFIDVDKKDILSIQNEVQEQLKPLLLKNGTWLADYRRIRITAYK
ncbi:MAG: SAM-dependent methyltransferase [Flavobacteriaceae bacterium]|nr:MAG: SAM-dependent methyltransferase [Flavobacteriaceae bacterium]